MGRIPLARVAAHELRSDAAPTKLGEDRIKREFGDDLDEEMAMKSRRSPQVPTPEQLALAGIAPPPAKPEAVIQPFAVAFAQVQAAAIASPKPALLDIPGAIPGAMPGAIPGAMPGATPGAMPGAMPDMSGMLGDATETEELPATPLEQAVFDMLDKHEAMPGVVSTTTDVARDIPTPRIAQAAPVALVRELPEMAAPTSHINLIMDDGDRRVVVTVAVRGSDVNVHLRGSDDLAAGLARNAGSLDEAMRARGLSLAELSAHREPDQRDARERPMHERRETAEERFALEETE